MRRRLKRSAWRSRQTRSRSQHLDRVLFQPSGILEREHDEHFRTIGGLQPAAERRHDRDARQILVLDVDELARRLDQIEVQPFDLERARYRRRRRPSGRCRRAHPRDRARHVRARSRVCCTRIGDRSPRSPDAIGRARLRRARGRPHRRRRPARRGTADTVRLCPRDGYRARDAPGESQRPPAMSIPPDKRQAIIDDGDLLMVARAWRMRAVEFQMDAGMVEGIAAPHQLGIAHVREQKRKTPAQDVNVEAGFASATAGRNSRSGGSSVSPLAAPDPASPGCRGPSRG